MLDRQIALTYEARSAPKQHTGQPVALVEFIDARQDKLRVGEVKHGFGFTMADVVIGDQEAGAWVSNALAAELECAGLQVEGAAHGARVNGETPSISGALEEFYITGFWKHCCRIRVRLTVTQGGLPVLDRVYATASLRPNLLNSAGEYERVSRLALQDLMQKVVPDILSVVR
jgi:hypothetical protein